MSRHWSARQSGRRTLTPVLEQQSDNQNLSHLQVPRPQPYLESRQAEHRLTPSPASESTAPDSPFYELQTSTFCPPSPSLPPSPPLNNPGRSVLQSPIVLARPVQRRSYYTASASAPNLWERAPSTEWNYTSRPMSDHGHSLVSV